MLNCIISCNRHSRARRTSENLFGIITTRWRIFLTTINAKPENVEHYTRAVMALHNMLIAETKHYSRSEQSDYFDRNGGLIDSEWRRDEELCNNFTTFNNIAPSSTRNASKNARSYVIPTRIISVMKEVFRCSTILLTILAKTVEKKY
jgi:hypothetical protein